MRPLIAIPCDRKPIDDLTYQAVGEKYATAVVDAAAGQPLLLPALPGPPEDAATLLAPFDGLLLTGSPSNVDPVHYGGPAPRDRDALDPARDGLTLPLIRHAIAVGLPLLAICRGHQEVNVALGGTLHQHVHEVPSAPGHAPRLDHREPYGKPVQARYAPRHSVTIEPGGLLETLLGPLTTDGHLDVNSLHGQAIDRPAPDVRIEARASDGTIEAISRPGAPGFMLSIQWHPDWRPLETPHYRALFAAFGDAARAYAQAKALRHDHPI